jgi:hypothetical protein
MMMVEQKWDQLQRDGSDSTRGFLVAAMMMTLGLLSRSPS